MTRGIHFEVISCAGQYVEVARPWKAHGADVIPPSLARSIHSIAHSGEVSVCLTCERTLRCQCELNALAVPVQSINWFTSTTHCNTQWKKKIIRISFNYLFGCGSQLSKCASLHFLTGEGLSTSATAQTLGRLDLVEYICLRRELLSRVPAAYAHEDENTPLSTSCYAGFEFE
jgi:hypothetical protein